MEFAILRSGAIKSKNFCPNPLIKYGIPSYADAIANSKVKNTPAYNAWWEEQVHYAINGYKTGGLFLPGRYYKFVNFDTIHGIAGDNIRAEMHDFQLDYAYLIEQAKTEHFNIVLPKARRKSVTTMTVCMVVDYGYRFLPNYKAAVVAGVKEHAEFFMDEWRYIDSKCFPEFRIKQLPDEETVAGWKQRTTDGDVVEMGTRNTIYVRTVFQNPNVLKGKFLHDIIYEESGENEHLLETTHASESCIMQGKIQRGVQYFYGTGGDMNKGSKGLKEIYYHNDKYNARRLFIPATVFLSPHYAGATDPNGKLIEDIPNLQHLKPHERIGWSDEEAALKAIEAEKKNLLQSADMKKYFDYCQNNPTNIKEVFLKSSSNNFPIIELNDQLHEIESQERKYSKFILQFKVDEKGQTIYPLEVEAHPAKSDSEEKDCILILDDGHPQVTYRWLDVAGIDSYDQDQTRTSKSLGAMVIFRRLHNIEGVPSWCPVALIRNRPKYKEEFYELCIKAAIYFNLNGTVLCDARTPMIMKHFVERGCERYLSKPPRKFNSPNSEALNQYGQSINNYSKPLMVSALQSLFFMHSKKVWFPVIIDEALSYDEFEVDSDNDTIDALGLALMKAIDMDQPAMDEEAMMKKNPYDYPSWTENQQGNIIDVTQLKEMNKDEPLGKYEDAFSRYARMLKTQDNDDAPNQNDIYSI